MACSLFGVFHSRLHSRDIRRIDEHGHTNCLRHQLAQEVQPLCYQFGRQEVYARHVSARPGEAGDKAEPDRVLGDDECDGDRGGCGFDGKDSSCTGYGNHGDLAANQIARERRQAIVATLRPAVFDPHVLAFDIAGILEALAKCAQSAGYRIW
jgi:hypothetical protein